MKFQYCFTFLCAVLLSNNFSLGQNFSFRDFENEKDSAQRVEYAAESWNYYVRNNLDSLRIVGLRQMNLDTLDLYGIGVRSLGSYHIRGGDINKGIGLLNKAKEIFSREKSQIFLSETENELGNALHLQGDYKQAANHYLASMLQGSMSSDHTAGYSGMIGFGKTLCAVGDTSRGVLFIQKYLERSLRDNKFEAASDACAYLGMIAGEKGKAQLMSAYYVRANIYAGRSNSKAYEANALTNKAINYFYEDKVDSAIYLFNESLRIRKEVGTTKPIVESFYNLAIVNIELERFAEAKKYAQSGESLSEESGIRSWQLDCLILLLEIAEKTNDPTNVESIKLDIDRIQKELNEMSSINSEIIDLAVDFTSLKGEQSGNSYFWEILTGLIILVNALLLMYVYRANLTSGGTRV